ncbi:MAG: response regulator [Flavobacteriales bacterium]
MKILYFEDNLIDQKSLERLLNKNYPNTKLYIASNAVEFNHILKKIDFDLILADQFIDSIHVFNYLKDLNNQKIVLVSGIDNIFEKESEIQVNLTGFLSKPIKASDLEKYIEKQSALEDLADGDKSFIMELKESIKAEIEREIIQYNEGDSNEVKANWIHKTKSKIALLEIHELHNKATKLEQDLRNDINCDNELKIYLKAYQKVLKEL